MIWLVDREGVPVLVQKPTRRSQVNKTRFGVLFLFWSHFKLCAWPRDELGGCKQGVGRLVASGQVKLGATAEADMKNSALGGERSTTLTKPFLMSSHN